MPHLPEPRGPISAALLSTLRTAPHALELPGPGSPLDPLTDDDLQLALYCSYELHYRGFDEVDERWEWHPSLLGLRAVLENIFETALHAAVGTPTPPAGPMDLALRAIADGDTAPSVSRHIERSGTVDEVVEFLLHRSAYNLKEADPHAWAIPRLTGRAKAALVEVLSDEYGGGRPHRVHARLFADVMEALGLSSEYGAYLDRIPGVTLATVNLMSFLGLHRRLRGALCGHLALFELTSSIPNRRYAAGLRRLGLDNVRATAFFDEHVEADSVHEQIAVVDIAGALARDEPALAGDIVWGARALAELDARWAVHVLAAWEGGRTSLRTSIAASTAVSG